MLDLHRSFSGPKSCRHNFHYTWERYTNW